MVVSKSGYLVELPNKDIEQVRKEFVALEKIVSDWAEGYLIDYAPLLCELWSKVLDEG